MRSREFVSKTNGLGRINLYCTYHIVKGNLRAVSTHHRLLDAIVDCPLSPGGAGKRTRKAVLVAGSTVDNFGLVSDISD